MDTALRLPFAPAHPACGYDSGRDPLRKQRGLTGAAAGTAIAGAREAPHEAGAIRLQLRRVAEGRFFAGVADVDLAHLFATRLPDDRQRILDVAEALVRHSWDRPAGAEFDRDPAGAWEPQHDQWLVRLAQAYVLTGDERYSTVCEAALDEWLDRPDAFADVGATAGADSGARIVSWAWVLMLLRDAAVADAWMTRVVAAIGDHASRIHHALASCCLPPTQATANALGLLYAAALCCERAEAIACRDTAVRLLVTQGDVQIAPDGVHYEQSTCLHAFTTDVYLHCMLLTRRLGVGVPPALTERVERMLDFLLAIRAPDGSMPVIGDATRASVVPLAPRPPLDSRGRFAVAAVLFGRGDFAWAAGGPAPDVAWLLGNEGVDAFDRLRAAPPAGDGSRIFPSGGYAVLRTGWQHDAHQMIVDVGPLGCPVSSGHGHADLLSVQCVVFGEPCLVDPGTHCSGGDSRWRDYFRSTGAHSALSMDGISQAEPTGPFGWRRQPRVRLREWHSTPDFDFVDAEHDGYSLLPDPVVHRRRVIFVKPGYWILVDDLAGRARHQIELTFQFGACDVRLQAHPWARAALPAGSVLWISPFPSAPAQPSLKCGDPSPIRGWIAPQIARLSPAPMLIYSFAVALPWRIVTLLLPDRQGLAAPPAVRPLYDAGGLPHGFVFERPRRVVRFDDRAVLVERD